MSNTDITAVAPNQNNTKTPTRTIDQGPTQSAFDFTISTSEKVQKELNKKYDLSKPFNGIVMDFAEISPEELDGKTSTQFASYITKGKSPNSQSKIYEYFVFVKGITDYYKKVTVEDLQVYILLKTAHDVIERGMLTSGDISIIEEEFKTKKERILAINNLQKKIKGGVHRFYSSKLLVSSDFMLTSVKFADENKMEFGELIGVINTDVEIPKIVGLQRKVRQHRRELEKIVKNKSDEKRKKLKQLEDSVPGASMA